MEQIQVLTKRDLSPLQVKELSTLHYKDGFMWSRFINSGNSSIIILAKTETKILGWGLLSKFSRKNKEFTLDIYVRKDFRRLGIGSKIALAAKQKSKNITVYRWNTAAKLFFDSVEL